MFQQMMQNSPQMQQQYMAFRKDIANNPQMQDQAVKSVIDKINNLPPAGGPTPPTNIG